MHFVFRIFLPFILLLVSCNGLSQKNFQKANFDDAIELVVHTSARLNNVIDTSFTAEMRFVFFHDYIFQYKKSIQQQRKIDTRSRKVEITEYSEGVGIHVNYKDSNSVYWVKKEGSDSVIKSGGYPMINRTILNYLFFEAFKSNELAKKMSGDTIYFNEVILSPTLGNKKFECITAIKKNNGGSDQKYLFNKIEEENDGKIVQCVVINPANELEAMVSNFTYNTVDNNRKEYLLRIIDSIKRLNRSIE